MIPYFEIFDNTLSISAIDERFDVVTFLLFYTLLMYLRDQPLQLLLEITCCKTLQICAC